MQTDTNSMDRDGTRWPLDAHDGCELGTRAAVHMRVQGSRVINPVAIAAVTEERRRAIEDGRWEVGDQLAGGGVRILCSLRRRSLAMLIGKVLSLDVSQPNAGDDLDPAALAAGFARLTWRRAILQRLVSRPIAWLRWAVMPGKKQYEHLHDKVYLLTPGDIVQVFSTRERLFLPYEIQADDILRDAFGTTPRPEVKQAFDKLVAAKQELLAGIELSVAINGTDVTDWLSDTYPHLRLTIAETEPLPRLLLRRLRGR
jgi:hypothetical protein